MNLPTERILLTVAEAHRLTGCGRTTLYKLIKQGGIRPVKVGRRTLFRVDELVAWIERLPRLGEAEASK